MAAAPSPNPNLNRTRDHLANERTFLAWVRTSLGLLGLGFVLARMGLFIRQVAEAGLSNGPRPVRLHSSHEFIISGVVFLVLGTALCGWSGWRYSRSQKAIEAGTYEPAFASVVTLTAVVVVGGLIVVGLVLFGPLGGSSK